MGEHKKKSPVANIEGFDWYYCVCANQYFQIRNELIESMYRRNICSYVYIYVDSIVIVFQLPVGYIKISSFTSVRTYN